MPLARLLYTQNPFYVISALLVLTAASSLFPAADSPSYAACLMVFLGVYTALLTAICIGIVRRGQVWDDARSLVVIIGILLYALALSFDELVFSRPIVGAVLLATTGIFGVGIVIGLFVGLGIRLPRAILLPFLAGFLATLLQPILVGGALRLDHAAAAQGILLGSPWLIAGLVLAAIATVRRPGWKAFAPHCPWSGRVLVMGILVLGVSGAIVRQIVLAETIATQSGSPFSPTVLTPLCFAFALVLAVDGRVRGSRPMRRLALGLPVLAVGLAFVPAATPAAREWLALLGRSLLPAEEIVVLTALVFYTLLGITKEREAWIGVVVCSGAVAARLVEWGWTGSLGPRRTQSALALLFGGVSLAIGVWISARKAREETALEETALGETVLGETVLEETWREIDLP